MQKALRYYIQKLRLWKHHLPLAVISFILILFINFFIGSKYPLNMWGVSTGYAGLVLLAATLILGPIKLLAGKRYPKSDDLRRDVGIWCAIWSLVHVIIGLQLHMGNPLLYFFMQDSYPKKLILRSDIFGFANYTGLAASLVILFLLLISNNYSMKKLGGIKWKSFQRWNYGLFGLILAHGILYLVLLDKPIVYIITFSLLIMVTIIFQGIGVLQWKKRAHNSISKFEC